MSIRTSRHKVSPNKGKFRPKNAAKSAAKLPAKPSVRRRRTAEEAKSEALLAARRLLLEEGPDAVILQRVAARVGVTHSNLLHHFGSAAELQGELMTMMVRDLTEALKEAVAQLSSDTVAPRIIVDIVFDAFESGGAGKLAAWIALSGKLPHLDAIEDALDELVKALTAKFTPRDEDSRMGMTSMVLLVALMGFGDALIGDPLKDMLKRERAAPRKIVTYLLAALVDPAMRAGMP